MSEINCKIKKADSLSANEISIWHEICGKNDLFKSPILSYEFVKTLSEVRDDVEVAVFYENETPIGFLAFHNRGNGFARPVGAPFSDYSAILTYENSQLKAEVALKLAGIKKFKAIGLLDPYNICGETYGEIDNAFGIDLVHDDIYNTASKKHRKNINRLKRRINDDLGEIEFVFEDKCPKSFDRMIELKEQQIKETGIHNFVSPDWVKAMFKKLCEADTNGLHGVMLTMKIAGIPVCMHFGVRLNSRVHAWIASYDPEYFKYSPGQIFLTDCHDALVQSGVAYYDLATGHSHYKDSFTNNHFIVKNCLLTDNGPKQNLKSGKLGNIYNKLYRRFDQIACLELNQIDRAKGVLNAFLNAKKRVIKHS